MREEETAGGRGRREVLHNWNPLQEDGAKAKHLEGDQRKCEAIPLTFLQHFSSPPPPPPPLSLSRFVQHHLLSQPPRAKLTSSSDQLAVEDSGQRFPLSGNIPSPHLVTGIVILNM